MVDLLSRFVLVETPSIEASASASGLDLVEEEVCSVGMTVSRHSGEETGGWLVAESGDGPNWASRQLLVGHVDTVWPIGTLEAMPLKVTDQTVEGPGALDMKGGLVQVIFALRAIAELGFRLPLMPIVFVNTDEEIGSPESTPALERLAAQSTRAFILEPSLGPRGALKTSRKGVRRYTVEVAGRSAHAGLDPTAGSNAITALADIVQQLIVLNDGKAGITVNVGMIEGGTRPNVVPDSARAVADVRAPTAADAAEVDRAIRSIRPRDSSAEVTVINSKGRPPMEPTPEGRELWLTAVEAGRRLGIELEQAQAGGASDGNTTSQFCPTLDGLGATGGGAHAAHEFVDIDRMVDRTALLVMLLASPGTGALTNGRVS